MTFIRGIPGTSGARIYLKLNQLSLISKRMHFYLLQYHSFVFEFSRNWIHLYITPAMIFPHLLLYALVSSPSQLPGHLLSPD